MALLASEALSPAAVRSLDDLPWANPLHEVQYERRSFGLDVLACRRCGGRLKHVATILDERVARRILEHVGMSARAPPEAPPRDPPPFWPAAGHDN